MEIKRLKLFSKDVQKQKLFYEHLGFSVLGLTDALIGTGSVNETQMKAGETELHFVESNKEQLYHFAFLIPTGLLESAIDFLKEKEIQLLPFQGKNIIQFNSGRAIYFYDADGNIAEFIERPTIEMEVKEGVRSQGSGLKFDVSQIIKVNEIGVPVEDTIRFSSKLIKRFDIELVEPDLISEQFCWIGDYNGVFIVTKIGRNWLPTQHPAVMNDFEIEFESKGKRYNIACENNEIKDI